MGDGAVMIKFKIPLIGLALLILLAGCGGEGTTDSRSRPFGTMSGTVLSILNDQPITDRPVSLEIWSVPIEAAGEEYNIGGMIKMVIMADGNGQFRRENIPIGKIWIRASADGFKRSPPKYWLLSPNAAGILNFTLYPGEGDKPFDPPQGWDVVEEGDGQEAFDPCYPGFVREGPHDDRQCGGD